MFLHKTPSTNCSYGGNQSSSMLHWIRSLLQHNAAATRLSVTLPHACWYKYMSTLMIAFIIQKMAKGTQERGNRDSDDQTMIEGTQELTESNRGIDVIEGNLEAGHQRGNIGSKHQDSHCGNGKVKNREVANESVMDLGHLDGMHITRTQDASEHLDALDKRMNEFESSMATKFNAIEGEIESLRWDIKSSITCQAPHPPHYLPFPQVKCHKCPCLMIRCAESMHPLKEFHMSMCLVVGTVSAITVHSQ